MARPNGLATVLSPRPLPEQALSAQRRVTTVINPLYPGADPWIAQRNGSYHLIQAVRGGHLAVWKSDTLSDRGERKIVWSPPPWGWNSHQIWAPELHWLRGKWYIYYAASSGHNSTHRLGVLESVSDDPQGAYVDRGQLYTGDDVSRRSRNRWAIDGTVLELHGRLYMIWSGWPDGRDIQHLYIARMENPWTIASERVRICNNDDHPWERISESRFQRGLNEGPAVLVRNGRVFLVYSCSASWQRSYKLGMLWMDAHADPMEPSSWRKFARPVFEPTRSVPGVGHCSFVQSHDGEEDWIVYHAKTSAYDGWERVVRANRFGWHTDGFPDFGTP